MWLQPVNLWTGRLHSGHCFEISLTFASDALSCFILDLFCLS